MNSDRTLLSLPLFFLNKVGIFNRTNTAMETINLAIILLGCAFVVIISSLQYFFIENNINDYISNLEATSGFIQIFGKVLYFVYKKDSFMKLIATSKCLWKIDICSKKVNHQLNKTYMAVLRFQNVIFTLTSICMVGILISIFFGRDLPVGIWKIDNYPKLYTFYKYVLNLILIHSSLAICTTDMLFIGLCYTLIIQFRILCNKIDNLNFDQSKSHDDLSNQYKQFNSCIEYHKFLLSYLNSIQSVYSGVFGIQYISSAPLICAEVYALMDKGEIQPLIFIRNILTAYYVCFQLAFYCIPADLVVQEAVTVANALYNSNWYSSNNIGLKKSLQIAIRASQREYQFTAWGMVEFKPATVLAVLKVAVSATTIFRQLENK